MPGALSFCRCTLKKPGNVRPGRRRRHRRHHHHHHHREFAKCKETNEAGVLGLVLAFPHHRLTVGFSGSWFLTEKGH